MRAEITERYEQYTVGQVVKGATAKVLVQRKKAKKIPEPVIIFAKMTQDALGLRDGAIVKGENAEIAIKAGIAVELKAADIPRRPAAAVTHKATVSLRQ